MAYLSLVALAIGWLGFHSINELHDLRIAVRELLVRCEIGLGFYKLGAFLEERMLYTEYELHYQKRGKWLRLEHWIVAMICLTFVALLWIEYSKSNSAKQNPRARITDCSIEQDVLFFVFPGSAFGAGEFTMANLNVKVNERTLALFNKFRGTI